MDTNEELLELMFVKLMEMNGKISALSHVQESLIAVICENSSELMAQTKRKINDISELSLSMGEINSEISKDIYKKEIEQSILRIEHLYREAATLSRTEISIKNK